MAGAANTNVTATLAINPIDDKALKALQRQIAAVGKANEKLQQQSLATFNPLIEQKASGGNKKKGGAKEEDESGGMSGAILGGMKRFAAGLLVMDTAVQAAITGLNSYHDVHQNNSQMARSMLRSNFAGRWLTDAVDAVGGRDAQMQQVTEKAQYQQVANAGAMMTHQNYTAYGVDQARMRERADQLANAKPILLSDFHGKDFINRTPVRNAPEDTPTVDGRSVNPRFTKPAPKQIDRSTAAGELEYKTASRLLPIKRAIAASERETAAATTARVKAEEHAVELSDEGNRLKTVQKKAADDLAKDNTSGAERLRLAKRNDNLIESVQTNREAQIAAQEKLRQAREQEAASKGQTGQLRAAEKTERANILEDRASTAGAAAENLGMMSPLERAKSQQAFEALQKFGPDALPADMKRQALAYGGDEARKTFEREGAKTKEFAAGQNLAPAVYGEQGTTPESMRREAGNARDDAERERMKNEASTAKSFADAGDKFGSFLKDQIAVFVNAAIAKIKNDYKQSKIQ